MDQRGATALIVAAKGGFTDKLSHLIAGGADVNIADFVCFSAPISCLLISMTERSNSAAFCCMG